MPKTIVRRLVPALALLSLTTAGAAEFTPLKLSFGAAAQMDGFTPTDAAAFDTTRGYGIERGGGAKVAQGADAAKPGSTFLTSSSPILFSAVVPEGNYHVTVWIGDSGGEADMVVKAESRRIMTPVVKTQKGEVRKVEFTLNIHQPKIDDKASVKLNDREQSGNARNWDDKLTLEFVGKKIAVAALSIVPDNDAVTVFLAGDSTVTDQAGEPWAAWGQLLPQFFTPKVAISNHAESGRTLRSFKGDKRWDKILSQVKTGDYVLIQFGHNDMKEKGDGVGAFTTFSASLKQYIDDTKAKGAHPVVLTPMHRRRFAGNEIQPTFGDYPDAIRKVAAAEDVPLIDLQKMSKPLYEFYGPEKAKRLFVYAAANTYPGQNAALHDDTHFNAFGAEQIARCVVQGLRDLKLPLADDLREGIPAFDPTHPGDPDAFDLPASVATKTVTPEGK